MSPVILNDIKILLEGTAPRIVDIGVNDGAEIECLLDLFPNCRIFAFEPDPRAAQRFKSRWNDQRITLAEQAVGRENGSALFYQSGGRDPRIPVDQHLATWPDGWDQSGSLRKPMLHIQQYPWCTFDASIQVAVTTLDDWANKSGLACIDLLWLDVQGAEIDVFSGANQILERTSVIYTEYSELELYEGAATIDELLHALPSFVPLRYDNGNVLLLNRSDRVFQANQRFFSGFRGADELKNVESFDDAIRRFEDVKRQLDEVESDRAQKDILILRLTREIERLVSECSEIDADRAAKDELIGRLTARLS